MSFQLLGYHQIVVYFEYLGIGLGFVADYFLEEYFGNCGLNPKFDFLWLLDYFEYYYRKIQFEGWDLDFLESFRFLR